MFDVVISEKTIFTSWSSEHKILRRYPKGLLPVPSLSFGSTGTLADKMRQAGDFGGNIRYFEMYALVPDGKCVPGLLQHRLFEVTHSFGVEFELEEDAVAFKLACP